VEFGLHEMISVTRAPIYTLEFASLSNKTPSFRGFSLFLAIVTDETARPYITIPSLILPI